jgi:hypothetical protein
LQGKGHSERVDEHAHEYVAVLSLTGVMNPIHQWYNQSPEFHANGFSDVISTIGARWAERKQRAFA